jgi:hypothetical protein
MNIKIEALLNLYRVHAYRILVMIAMFFPLMLQVQRRRSVFRSGGLVSFHPVAHTGMTFLMARPF